MILWLCVLQFFTLSSLSLPSFNNNNNNSSFAACLCVQRHWLIPVELKMCFSFASINNFSHFWHFSTDIVSANSAARFPHYASHSCRCGVGVCVCAFQPDRTKLKRTFVVRRVRKRYAIRKQLILFFSFKNWIEYMKKEWNEKRAKSEKKKPGGMTNEPERMEEVEKAKKNNIKFIIKHRFLCSNSSSMASTAVATV